MKQLLLSLALAGLATTANATCYADYKATMDNPLRLHYGVAEVSEPCSVEQAAADLAPRLSAEGWTLLNVLSVFADDGLEERKESAGPNYLRF